MKKINFIFLILVFLIFTIHLSQSLSSSNGICTSPPGQTSSNPQSIWEILVQWTSHSCGNAVVSVFLRHYNLTTESLNDTYIRSINITNDTSLGGQDLVNLIDSLLRFYNRTANFTVYVSFPPVQDPSPNNATGVGTVTPATSIGNMSLNGSMIFVLFPEHWVGIINISNPRATNSTGGITPGGKQTGSGGTVIPPVPGPPGTVWDIEYYDPGYKKLREGHLYHYEWGEISNWYFRTGKSRWVNIKSMIKYLL